MSEHLHTGYFVATQGHGESAGHIFYADQAEPHGCSLHNLSPDYLRSELVTLPSYTPLVSPGVRLTASFAGVVVSLCSVGPIDLRSDLFLTSYYPCLTYLYS